MAKIGASARNKGAAFERWLGQYLSEKTGKDWKRGLGQTRGGGAETSDVKCDDYPLIHIEAKNQVRCNPRAALKQALEDCEKKPTGTLPVIITKDMRAEPIVTMRLEDWIELFKHYKV